MDWVAIGAVATVVMATIAYFQLRKPTQQAALPLSVRAEKPAIVSFRIDTVVGSIPSKLYQPLRKDEFDLDYLQLTHTLQCIGASRIEIKNQSTGIVSDVRLRLQVIGNIYSLNVAKTEKLAKEAVRIEASNESIRICIEEMPKGEVIVIAVFHEGHGSAWLRPERANIDLVSEDIYLIRYSGGP